MTNQDPVLTAPPILERFRLDDRTALVTGGGQGIGRAFAHALAQAGAAVAVVDIHLANAETVANEIIANGGDAIAIKADVTQPDLVAAMIATIIQKWGKLTIGVNNAGMGQWIAAEEIPVADWDKMMDLNLKAVFLCCQAEAKIMLAAGYGKIINTASMSGSISNTPQNQAHYNVSKAGVMHLTRSLGAEWAERGVRVNSISPGYTRTALVQDLLDTPQGQSVLPVWMSMTPMKRMAEVTDLQGSVVFLAASVSDFMTGSDLIIDGGYCAW